MLDHLCEECAEHFAQVRAHLDALGIAYQVNPRIVRGLDYYTKTAFEFQHDALGAQDSIGGGGRYDGLIEQCGGPPTPGVGIGIGIERLLLVREALRISDEAEERAGILVVTVGDKARMPGYELLHELRQAGLSADMDYRRRSLRAQLRFADAEGFEHAVILGPDELIAQNVVLRDLEASRQWTLDRKELLPALTGGRQPPEIVPL